MIIDLILDRKDGADYRPARFYRDVLCYGRTWPEFVHPICAAMDYGTDYDIQDELCNYVIQNDYNPAICDYIRSVTWLGFEVLTWPN